MELTAQDLHRKGIVDEIISEPADGVEQCVDFVISQMDALIERDLKALGRKKTMELTAERYEKFRKIGA